MASLFREDCLVIFQHTQMVRQFRRRLTCKVVVGAAGGDGAIGKVVVRPVTLFS